MSDALVSGRKIRLLTMVDEFSKESPVSAVEYSMSGESVVRALERLTAVRGMPSALRMDNGPELRSKALVAWAVKNGVRLDYVTPGKPTENAFIESFNGRLREECLDQEIFLSLDDAKAKVEQWRRFYNVLRPHSALGGMPPSLFASKLKTEVVLTGT